MGLPVVPDETGRYRDQASFDLQAFDPKPIERNSNLRGGRNADLVLALAVALWWGDKLTWADDVGRRRYEPKDTRVSHWAV